MLLYNTNLSVMLLSAQSQVAILNTVECLNQTTLYAVVTSQQNSLKPSCGSGHRKATTEYDNVRVQQYVSPVCLMWL